MPMSFQLPASVALSKCNETTQILAYCLSP